MLLPKNHVVRETTSAAAENASASSATNVHRSPEMCATTMHRRCQAMRLLRLRLRCAIATTATIGTTETTETTETIGTIGTTETTETTAAIGTTGMKCAGTAVIGMTDVTETIGATAVTAMFGTHETAGNRKRIQEM